MCEESHLPEFDRKLALRGLTRREFAVLGTAAIVVGCGGNTSGQRQAAGGLSEATVTIETPDGQADAFFAYPADGPAPGVIMWPDVAGLREAFKLMARRLAGEGYAVLVPNPYYRDSAAPQFESFSGWMTEVGRATIAPMREALTPEAVMRDAAAYVAWLDGQDAVDTARGIGSNGYCMSGSFTVYAAHQSPGRIRAAASFHGGGMVRMGDSKSPHNLLDETQASFLFAIAQDDNTKQPGMDDALADAATQAGRPAEVEVYPAGHGWTVPDTPSYDEAAAERAWARLLALYSGL